MTQPNQQPLERNTLKPYVFNIWQTFKFYEYRRITAYSQQTSGPKVSEYMTLKLMRKLGIRSCMQKRYRKPKTCVTVDQRLNMIRHLNDLSSVWIMIVWKCFEVFHSILNREEAYLKANQILDEVQAAIG